MHSVALLFPNQLFKDHPVLREKPKKVVLIQHSLFFGDSRYPLDFHPKKIDYHKITMGRYAETLANDGCDVQMVPVNDGHCQLVKLCQQLSTEGTARLITVDPCDFILKKRLQSAATSANLTLELLPNPGFINTREQNNAWKATQKRWQMAEFYKFQRTRLDLLMDNNKPEGGQWSFDEENRKKIPVKGLSAIPELTTTDYPTTHEEASLWLEEFLSQRFEQFGPYEDAIEQGQNWLYHSVLTPAMNIGLLTPEYVISKAISHAKRHSLPINSVEGFVRQIIGWREFMRATYEDLGVQMRTGNHWKHNRTLPQAFYDGTTGILPVDDCINRVNQHAYCHHIERLMILGGFMFLCEIKPDDIYRWFMERFIDSYDWVMVPNVYAMSQNADGGLITTKPYFSGSNYVIKMSHYKKGTWSEIWDGLFWRWIFKHKTELAGNHRWSMMCRNAERMEATKKQQHLDVADNYLASLFQ